MTTKLRALLLSSGSKILCGDPTHEWEETVAFLIFSDQSVLESINIVGVTHLTPHL
jgi:hypothetical protein